MLDIPDHDVLCIQEAAAAQREIDLDLRDGREVLSCRSDTYDSLTEEEQAEIDPEIKEALETVRNRIAALISSDSGVTATGNPWYVQTHVQENPDQEQTIQELSEAYPGTLPQLLYDIEISYTDIRTGEAISP
ncbi:MAG: hypothetical protein ACLUGJ_09960 [Blautia wexlerae]